MYTSICCVVIYRVLVKYLRECLELIKTAVVLIQISLSFHSKQKLKPYTNLSAKITLFIFYKITFNIFTQGTFLFKYCACCNKEDNLWLKSEINYKVLSVTHTSAEMGYN